MMREGLVDERTEDLINISTCISNTINQTINFNYLSQSACSSKSMIIKPGLSSFLSPLVPTTPS